MGIMRVSFQNPSGKQILPRASRSCHTFRKQIPLNLLMWPLKSSQACVCVRASVHQSSLIFFNWNGKTGTSENQFVSIPVKNSRQTSSQEHFIFHSGMTKTKEPLTARKSPLEFLTAIRVFKKSICNMERAVPEIALRCLFIFAQQVSGVLLEWENKKSSSRYLLIWGWCTKALSNII